jgi:hypothetical protein
VWEVGGRIVLCMLQLGSALCSQTVVPATLVLQLG